MLGSNNPNDTAANPTETKLKQPSHRPESNGYQLAAPKPSHSVIHDPTLERKLVWFTTLSIMSAAASYIVMIFIALPLTIHTIVNTNNGCLFEVNDQCFAPTDESQRQLTLTLTFLRVFTFLTGSVLGSVSDRFGRRPVMFLALVGYATAGVLFTLGWAVKRTALFVLGAVILGAASPIGPHGLAYLSDISPPRHLAKNVGIYQGFGYFFGLMAGAVISLVIGLFTTGRNGGDDSFAAHNALFYASYITGTLLAALAAGILLLALPESLHEHDRTQRLDWRKANPLGFIPLFARNKYLLTIWISGLFLWMSVGSSEAVSGGWWLRRYAVSNTTTFIVFTVILWLASGIGAAFVTRIVAQLRGLKFVLHMAAIISVLAGVVYALAPSVPTSYIVVPLSLFAAPALPATLALLMGQVGPREKGAMAGGIRSSEAGAKFIGILVFGNTFSLYIEPFTPDPTCIPPDYDPASNPRNDCYCGVETCPVMNAAGELVYVPSQCSLGWLTQIIEGKASKYETNLGDPIGSGILPQVLIGTSSSNRDDAECLASKYVTNAGGLVTKVDRSWCAPEGNSVREMMGCVGFDFTSWRHDVVIKEEMAECQVNPATCNETLAGEALDYSEEEFEVADDIGQRVIDPNHEGGACPDQGLVELNVCLKRPLANFPGLFVFLCQAVLPLISYIFFLIAQRFFVQHDLKQWKDIPDPKKTEFVVEKNEFLASNDHATHTATAEVVDEKDRRQIEEAIVQEETFDAKA